MLDSVSKNEIISLLRTLNKEKKITFIYITHEVEEIILANRVIIFDRGRIFLDGPPLEVFQKVEEIRSTGLEVPSIVELFYELKREGIKIEKNIIESAEAARYLFSILNK
jgi:ABC-type multidrug transport system ATPase subunit